MQHYWHPIRLPKLKDTLKRRIFLESKCINLPLARKRSSCKMHTAFRHSIDASISVQSVNIFHFRCAGGIFFDDTKLRWHFIGCLLIHRWQLLSVNCAQRHSQLCQSQKMKNKKKMKWTGSKSTFSNGIFPVFMTHENWIIGNYSFAFGRFSSFFISWHPSTLIILNFFFLQIFVCFASKRWTWAPKCAI